MSGEEELATESRLKQFESELDSFIDSIGISFVKDDYAIKALELTYDQLVKISPQEALIANFKLQQYGLYILSLYNRAENIKNWANHNLNVIVGKYGQQYGDKFTKFEERRCMVVAGNTFAYALNNILLKASSKSTELNKIADKVDKIAYALHELSKKKENHG